LNGLFVSSWFIFKSLKGARWGMSGKRFFAEKSLP
jgi:hypothetical protein